MKGLINRLKSAWMAFCNPQIVETEDSVTGVLTRRNFVFLAQKEITRAQRGQRPLSLVFIDLDSLKNINDTQGHRAGDLYLKRFSEIVFSNIRAYDVFARWGGDEFILLLPGTTPSETESIIQRIYDLFPDFSYGISTWVEGMTIEELIKDADTQMYHKKRTKKESRGNK